jgi:ATP-dependent 26S proteasome regulatory subunit
MLGADEKPDVKYSDVGGLDQQKQEIREAVELPLVQVSYGDYHYLAELMKDGPVQEDWY